jgi:hypothetical protein
LDGVIALVTVVVIGSQACCDRMVTLKDCRFVPSTVWNVQVTGPVDAGSPGRSIVRVPLQVPSRNERPGDGPVGPLASFPQPAVAASKSSDNHARVLRILMTNLRIWGKSIADTAPG